MSTCRSCLCGKERPRCRFSAALSRRVEGAHAARGASPGPPRSCVRIRIRQHRARSPPCQHRARIARSREEEPAPSSSAALRCAAGRERGLCSLRRPRAAPRIRQGARRARGAGRCSVAGSPRRGSPRGIAAGAMGQLCCFPFSREEGKICECDLCCVCSGFTARGCLLG